jgi:hypothetical protein
MKMWIEKVAMFFLVIFAFIGGIGLTVVVHEYSHFSDFRKFNVTNEQLCGLNLPINWDWKNLTYNIKQPIGYYSYKVNKTNPDVKIEYEKISKNTELKAYAISLIVLAFFFFCYWAILHGRLKDEIKILEQEIESVEKDMYINQLEEFIRQQQEYDNNTQFL